MVYIRKDSLINRKRFLTSPSGYLFDKRIFQLTCAFIILMTALIVARYGLGTNIYYNCPQEARGGYCENPFINEYGFCLIENDVLCNQKVFPQGFTYGNKPGWLISNIILFFFASLVLAFVINHYKNNPRWAA